MKLLVDMNLSPRWIGLLEGAGIEAVHWSSVGARNAPDAQIMAYASASGSIVLTHDLDFGAILAATHGEKPSVVPGLRPGHPLSQGLQLSEDAAWPRRFRNDGCPSFA